MVVPDSSDQILEKYRTKTFEESGVNKLNDQAQKASRIRRISESTIISNQGCNTFRDIKNKLRMVLSQSTVQLPGDIKVRKKFYFFIYSSSINIPSRFLECRFKIK